MAYDTSSPNLKLWLSLEKTDPSITKPIEGRPFKGTATNPTHTMKRLTEAFGPVGWGWGYRVREFADTPTPAGIMNSCHIVFWYFPFGRDVDGEHAADPLAVAGCAQFDQVGATELAGTRANGKPFHDDEARKKSLTDAITKAASHIGIAADIHLGQFDDSKYLSDRKAEAAAENVAAQTAGNQAAHAALLRDAEAIVQELANAETEGAVMELRARANLLRPRLNTAGLRDPIGILGRAVADACRHVGLPAPEGARPANDTAPPARANGRA